MLKQKKFTRFRPKIFSRHPTHSPLRTKLPLMPFRSVVRLGSTTNIKDSVTNGGERIECNTIESIKNASNKRLMKQCFTNGDVKTAEWFTYFGAPNGGHLFLQNGIPNENNQGIQAINLPFPIVAKHIHGSRGQGNYKLDTLEELQAWFKGKTIDNYIFEKFYNFSREYRLHVTSEGCFYTCRKVLRADTPDDKKWFRNDSNSNWWVETNEGFDKPTNWDAIEEHCVRALNAVGLDIGGCDVKVQSRKKQNGEDREFPEFIIIEINSACSLGDITEVKYLETIPKVLTSKYNQ